MNSNKKIAIVQQNKDRIKGCLLKQQGMYKNIFLKPSTGKWRSCLQHKCKKGLKTIENFHTKRLNDTNLRSHPHIPGRYPQPLTNIFCFGISFDLWWEVERGSLWGIPFQKGMWEFFPLKGGNFPSRKTLWSKGQITETDPTTPRWPVTPGTRLTAVGAEAAASKDLGSSAGKTGGAEIVFVGEGICSENYAQISQIGANEFPQGFGGKN